MAGEAADTWDRGEVSWTDRCAPSSSADTSMRSLLLRRLLLALLPAMVIASVGLSAIWGDNGLMARHRLERELAEASADLAGMERENQRLLRELVLMEQDPLTMERLVAEELGWGGEDTTIYRFESSR